MVQHVVTATAPVRVGRLRLATETLRSLALGAVTASKGNPCYSRYCSDGPPCGSQVGCP